MNYIFNLIILDNSPLLQHQDTFYTIIVSLLTDDTNAELRKVATGGVTVLLSLPNMVKEAELPTLAEHLRNLLLKENDEDVR